MAYLQPSVDWEIAVGYIYICEITWSSMESRPVWKKFFHRRSFLNLRASQIRVTLMLVLFRDGNKQIKAFLDSHVFCRIRGFEHIPKGIPELCFWRGFLEWAWVGIWVYGIIAAIGQLWVQSGDRCWRNLMKFHGITSCLENFTRDHFSICSPLR